MEWAELQTDFSKALRKPSQAAPEPVSNVSSERRFNVYRNNVMVSLRESLETSFPVVKALVGDEFFAAMAKAFVQDNLPRSPLLSQYGASLPDFIAEFEPAKDLPYLVDTARLEYLQIESCHAADSQPLDISVLSNLEPEQFETLTFVFNPSMRLIRSHWPVVSIWQKHQGEASDVSLADLVVEPEHALIVRPELEVDIHRVDEGAFVFLQCLHEGKTLNEASEMLGTEDQSVLSGLIGTIFNLGLVSGLKT